jgi:RNA polymerase sigma factor (sigma-70 family)
MIAGRPSKILRQLEECRIPDCELLERFVRERDEAAFAELVRSHGPVVLGVCRRVTGHPQDAEDAFQAVFLTLARKAATIRNPDVIGSWLYRVAVDVARKVRRSTIRRRVREFAVSSMPYPPASFDDWSPDLARIIDEELAALPSWYRDAIILCDLNGVSREEAAAALNIPLGTVSSRLANGRKKLARRLIKRGIALATAAIPTTLSPTQAAVVSNDLVEKTCRLVTDWVTGAAIPRPLLKLTQGGITVRKMLVIVMLTSAAVIAGAVFAAQPTPQNTTQLDPPKPPVIAKQEVAEQPAVDVKPVDKAIAFTSKPKLREAFDLKLTGDLTVYWNSQGTHLAISGQDVNANNLVGAANSFPWVNSSSSIHLLQIDSGGNGRIQFTPQENSKLVGFTPDGKQIVTTLHEYKLISGIHRMDFWQNRRRMVSNVENVIESVNTRSLNLDSRETEGCAFASDGKTFRTVGIDWNFNVNGVSKINVLEVDASTGKQLKTLLSLGMSKYVLSNDGKRLAVFVKDEAVDVYDVDRATKLFTYKLPAGIKYASDEEEMQSLGAAVWSHAPSMMFSPDGRCLLVCRGIGEVKSLALHYYEVNLPRNKDLILSGGLGQTVVLNSDTGAPLPPLEGGECLAVLPGRNAFTADGRLLALSGGRYAVKMEKVGTNPQRERYVLERNGSFLTVWDTQTGKIIKNWNQNPQVAFNPVRPLLAILESNGGNSTRVGLWDFSVETAEKK